MMFPNRKLPPRIRETFSLDAECSLPYDHSHVFVKVVLLEESNGIAVNGSESAKFSLNRMFLGQQK